MSRHVKERERFVSFLFSVIGVDVMWFECE